MTALKTLRETSHVRSHKIVSVNCRVKTETRWPLVCPSVSCRFQRIFRAQTRTRANMLFFSPTKKLPSIPRAHTRASHV